ncbi:MAG TPA: phasin family protein [Steroidobacteraceae bacterium]|jgi:poly(hydroxyalkanoate) granule-associated protein|nr:phasin family protein [Steroidobacteraceae bacterium]
MAVKKKGKLGGGETKPEKDLLYSAQQIWQAGLGALARAQAGAPKVFEELMREGGKLQGGALDAAQKAVMQAFRGAQQTVKGRVDTVKVQAGETWDNLEKIFQVRVQRAMQQLNMPSADEIRALSRRVDELGERVDRLSRMDGAKRSSRPARRRSKSS